SIVRSLPLKRPNTYKPLSYHLKSKSTLMRPHRLPHQLSQPSQRSRSDEEKGGSLFYNKSVWLSVVRPVLLCCLATMDARPVSQRSVISVGWGEMGFLH